MRVARRDLLAGAAVALAAAAVPAARAQDRGGDGAVLIALLAAEQATALAHDTAIGTGLLDPAAVVLLGRLREADQEHADALRAALDDLGGTAPVAPRPEDLEGLGAAVEAREVLRAVLDVERRAVAVYLQAHRRLADRELLHTVATIMAAEGRHLVVLRHLLGAQRVPTAFETGAR